MKNRIVGDLLQIRQNTDTLRLNLINGGLNVDNRETLTGLVAKVPLLYSEPAPTPPEKEWKPDPLWLFPDPNGSANSKTIEEIYNEDLMAGDYTYRAIYMINGAFPTTNLRGGRTTGHVITYITSDGETYTDTTGTTLEHAWDTTKDVIDSNGNPVRYIKVYTNTAQTTVQNFYNTLVWVVYNLGTTISGGSSQNSNNGFNNNYALQSIIIPDSVTSIGNNAFNRCSSLQSIIIPDSVTSIGQYAFNGCSSLQSIIIPDSVTSIGSNAFNRCIALQSIIIPDSVTSIGSNAFQYCSSLQSIIIPDGVTSIGSNAFDGCYALQSIIIPDSVTSIGSKAFNRCSSLQSIIIPDSVTSIGQYAFDGCSSLQSIIIPDSVTSIGSNAFDGCYALISVILPFEFKITGLNFTQSTQFSTEAIVSMFEQLKDVTGQPSKTITIGTVNKSKLTTEQPEIATNKNWTVG